MNNEIRTHIIIIQDQILMIWNGNIDLYKISSSINLIAYSEDDDYGLDNNFITCQILLWRRKKIIILSIQH